jgi:hypothetical protein
MGSTPVFTTRDATPAFNQRHYSAAELAEAWALDQSTIRRMFQDQPGVLKIGKVSRRDGKRDYVTLRIPESVAARFHREHLQ